MVLPVSIVPDCLAGQRVALVVEEHVDEVLVHRLVEGYGHRGVTLHAERRRAVQDGKDGVSRQDHLLVALGEDLNRG